MRRRAALLTKIAAFAVLMVGIVPLAHGSVIVSNISDAPAGTFATAAHINDAQSFTVPTGPSETVQDVVVELFGNGSTASFSFYTNISGHPGNGLGTLANITPSIGSGYATYTFTSTDVLAPGQTYWLITSYTGAANWAYTSSTSYTGTGTLGNSEYSPDGGATWLASPAGPFLLQIDATTGTPEPAAILLVLLPLVGLGALKRALQRS